MSITKLLAESITNYGSRKSIGSKLRARRVAPLVEIIAKLSNEHDHVNIIDIGGTEEYWNIFPNGYLEKHNVRITIANLPVANSPEDHGLFTFLNADGCDLACFTDNSFHIAHSNSVIEHVGDWNRMVLFSTEVKRVAQKYFVQTPNYWFPMEPHCMTPFFHWFPKPIRIWLVMKFGLGHWEKATSTDEAVRIVDSARLLNKKMFNALFDDSRILVERFAFLPKSFIALRE